MSPTEKLIVLNRNKPEYCVYTYAIKLSFLVWV
jgi:hypothetical protein